MITEEEYLKSLSKLEEREKLSVISTENGKIFTSQYLHSIEKSRQNNTNIFILFYMKGCDACNIIKYIIDNDNNIKEALSKYEILFCDTSNTKTNLVQKYNIYSYPTCLIIDSNEKVIKQKIGIKVMNGPQNDFLVWLQ